MAQIALGIDVDTSSVRTADAAVDRLTGSVHGLDRASGNLADASRRSAAGVRGVADAARLSEQRTRAAVAEMGRLQAQLGSIRAVASAAAGALAGYIGVGVIRNVVSFAQEMERLDRTFTTVTGSSEAARAEMGYVERAARELGQSIGTASSAYAKLFAAADAAKVSLSDTRVVFEGLASASTALGISQQDFEGSLLAVQQMMAKGVVSAEELRGQLGERLPVAFGVAADAMGMTMAQLSKALETGKVSAQKFVGAFGRELLERYGDVAKGATGVTRTLNDLQNAMRDLGKATLDAGLLDALLSVTRILTQIAQSGAAAATLETIGRGLKLVADNGSAAAIGVGLLAAALSASPFGRAVGAITAVAGAVSAVKDRTVEAAGEQVKIGLVISTAWKSVVAETKAAGEVIAAVYSYMAASAEVIPERLRGVWARVQVDFYSMMQGITSAWAGFVGFLADKASALPDFLSLKGDLAAAAAESQAYLGKVQGQLATAQKAVAAHASAVASTVAPAWERVVKAAEGYSKAAENSAAIEQRVADTTAATRVESEKLVRLTAQRAELGSAAAAAAGQTATKLDVAGKAAKKVADELARARDVLNEQVSAHQRVLAQITGAKVETGYVADETARLVEALDKSGVSLDGFLKTVGMTRDEYRRMLGETEKVTAQIDHQKKAAGELVTALRGLAFGTLTGAEGIGGAISALTDGAFGETLNKAFEGAADTLSDAFGKAMSGLGNAGLSDFATASIGTGIGIAATGVLNGNAQQIGGGIGSAIGGAIGSSLTSGMGGLLGAVGGPVGMILGGLAGGFLSKLFGGNDDWQGADVTAFSGTSYERTVSARFNTTNEGATPVARGAVIATMDLLKDFNAELRDYVDSLGGTVRSGTKVLVDQKAALKAITGFTDDWDAPRSGPEATKIAETISQRVSEVMGVAASLVQKSGLALTNAQKAWRETQERFSAENMEILRSLGFTAKQMRDAQATVKRDLAEGFSKEMLDALTDTGRATKAQVGQWKDAQLAALADERAAATATAKELGASVGLVAATFKAKRADILEEWRDMLADMAGEIEKTMTWAQRRSARFDLGRETINTLVGTGRATRSEIDEWREYEIKALRDRKAAALETAKSIGFSARLVNASFDAQQKDIVAKWRTMLADIAGATKDAPTTWAQRVEFSSSALSESVQSGDAKFAWRWKYWQKQAIEIERKQRLAEAKRLGSDLGVINRLYNQKLLDIDRQYHELRNRAAKEALDAVIDSASTAIRNLNDTLSRQESKRSDVLGELTSRAEEARRAEQALADARRGLAGGDLNPGGPMDRFRALQGQFNAAIRAAPGNAEMVGLAANLAQSLLQAGRGIHASGPGYVDLFRKVNSQLLAVQRSSGTAAKQIEKRLDARTFVETSERSTKALLAMLGRLDQSVKSVEARIKAQTDRLEVAQQRQRVA